MLSFDGEVKVSHTTCSECDQTHETSTGFVLRDDDAYAVYWVSWYPHHDEAWLDLILGSWQEPTYDDHVTFGCRIGAVDGEPSPECTLVAGGQTRSDHVMFGRKLTRDEALSHPRLKEFWDCVDWLVINDPVLHDQIYHQSRDER